MAKTKAKARRVKLSMNAACFSNMVRILEELPGYIDSTPDFPFPKEWDKDWMNDKKRAGKRLLKTFLEYGHFEVNEEGVKEARLELYPTEAQDLLWQFIIALYDDEMDTTYYDHFKDGTFEVEEALTRNAAGEMYEQYMVGAVYLVKNKDGKCYFVDHGFSGELIKTADHWEDKKYGFEDYEGLIFSESKREYKIVSWEDKEPLDVYKYLVENGWMSEECEFIG